MNGLSCVVNVLVGGDFYRLTIGVVLAIGGDLCRGQLFKCNSSGNRLIHIIGDGNHDSLLTRRGLRSELDAAGAQDAIGIGLVHQSGVQAIVLTRHQVGELHDVLNYSARNNLVAVQASLSGDRRLKRGRLLRLGRLGRLGWGRGLCWSGRSSWLLRFSRLFWFRRLRRFSRNLTGRRRDIVNHNDVLLLTIVENVASAVRTIDGALTDVSRTSEVVVDSLRRWVVNALGEVNVIGEVPQSELSCVIGIQHIQTAFNSSCLPQFIQTNSWRTVVRNPVELPVSVKVVPQLVIGICTARELTEVLHTTGVIKITGDAGLNAVTHFVATKWSCSLVKCRNEWPKITDISIGFNTLNGSRNTQNLLNRQGFASVFCLLRMRKYRRFSEEKSEHSHEAKKRQPALLVCKTTEHEPSPFLRFQCVIHLSLPFQPSINNQ